MIFTTSICHPHILQIIAMMTYYSCVLPKKLVINQHHDGLVHVATLLEG